MHQEQLPGDAERGGEMSVIIDEVLHNRNMSIIKLSNDIAAMTKERDALKAELAKLRELCSRAYVVLTETNEGYAPVNLIRQIEEILPKAPEVKP